MPRPFPENCSSASHQPVLLPGPLRCKCFLCILLFALFINETLPINLYFVYWIISVFLSISSLSDSFFLVNFLWVSVPLYCIFYGIFIMQILVISDTSVYCLKYDKLIQHFLNQLGSSNFFKRDCAWTNNLVLTSGLLLFVIICPLLLEVKLW